MKDLTFPQSSAPVTSIYPTRHNRGMEQPTPTPTETIAQEWQRYWKEVAETAKKEFDAANRKAGPGDC